MSEEIRKQIEQKAYFKWLDAGQPPRREKYFWDLAEKEVINELEEYIEVDYIAPKKFNKKWKRIEISSAGFYYAPYVPVLYTGNWYSLKSRKIE